MAHNRIRDAFHRFAQTIEAYGGRTLELSGDVLLAEFARASDAVSASLPQPGHVCPQLLLMGSYGQLEQTEKAQEALGRLKSHVPGVSLAAADIVQVFVLNEDHHRLLDGLDRAGVLDR